MGERGKKRTRVEGSDWRKVEGKGAKWTYLYHTLGYACFHHQDIQKAHHRCQEKERSSPQWEA